MGSSKKHKEKKDKKKHKKGRSRSREREHKRSHKSSHRKDKRRSPDLSAIEIPDERKPKQLIERDEVLQLSSVIEPRESERLVSYPNDSDDDFDVEKLLDSKLSENKEFSSASNRVIKKRRREEAIEQFRKRNKLDVNEDSLEKFADQQLLEEHGLSTPSQSTRTSFNRIIEPQSMESVVVKKEPLEDQFENDDFRDRQSLSIAETNKLRAKLGLKPLRIEKEKAAPATPTEHESTSKSRSKIQSVKHKEVPDFSSAPAAHRESEPISKLRSKIQSMKHREITDFSSETENKTIAEANKLRATLGLTPIDEKKQSTPSDDTEIIEANKLRAKLGLKPLNTSDENAGPEFSESQLSLSIAETNKLRAKLGLKPLDVKSDSQDSAVDGEKEISKPAAEVFVKTENIAEKKKSEALREKLKVMKEKRSIEHKLRKTKGVADSDSEDESAASWVIKHQKLLTEKEAAEKRAKLLEEMDEEFGVGALVEEEFVKKETYTSQNLKGLTIGHDINSFQEGHQMILTLKDKGVLDEEEDVLENVNIVDSERYSKNVENKKKKPDYRPYEEPEFDEFGILKKKNLLSKYDEEIEGEKKRSFKIGTTGGISQVTKEQELELIRMKLRQQNVMSLEMPEMKIANEYLTAEDMVQFKKPKKKKKIQKRPVLKADDLLSERVEESEKDFGSRRNRRRKEIDNEDVDFQTNVTDTSGIPLIDQTDETIADLSEIVIDEDTAEKELNSALNKAKKLKERKIMATAPEKVIEILSSVDGSGLNPQKDKAGNIEMNSVAEFCRTLGDIPTYGMSGNRDEEAEDLMDIEREFLDEKSNQDIDAQNQGAWNEVDIEEKPAEISMRDNEPILEEEPDIATGVAGALKLATKKGYLDKETKKAANATKSSTLQAQSYTIEEKFYEDDKFGKRDRYTGPIQDFKEKNNYKPDVKLEYIDDSGRLLTAKEAFRYLSHKFHGKGPGKNKVDKRMKKLDQDTRLKQMSSTDTPLNTVKLLQLKQRETQSPYIVLSGGNKTLTQTMISKTKQP